MRKVLRGVGEKKGPRPAEVQQREDTLELLADPHHYKKRLGPRVEGSGNLQSGITSSAEVEKTVQRVGKNARWIRGGRDRN